MPATPLWAHAPRVGQPPRLLVLAGLFLVTLVIHAASPVTTSTDSAWTLHLAASILREGDIDLDEYRPLMDLSLDYRLRSINGHIYYYYPAATPLLVTPAVALGNLLMAGIRPTDLYSYLAGHAPDQRTARMEKMIASGIVAMAAVVMCLVAMRFLNLGQSLAIALIFGFATSMWSTASRALWQHGPSVLLLTMALYLTLAATEKPWAVFATGLILAFAYMVRPTNSISFAAVGLFHLLNARRRILAFALGALTALVPYALQNWTSYGDIFPPYAYQLFERLGTPTQIGEALLGTLVSPNRGLFVFMPLLLFAVYGACLCVKRSGWHRENLDVYLLGIPVAHWITTSLFEDWGGAWSIGPRYFVDILPYLIYFLIPVLETHFLRPAAVRTAFSMAVVFSTLVQFHCSVSPYPFMWNGKPRALVDAPERKWDWADLQFLRGACEDDPMEGRAPACWLTSDE